MKRMASMLFMLSVITACSDNPTGGEMPPAKVSVMTVEPTTVVVRSEVPARVSASLTAEVRPQVGGIILKRLFEEGHEIQEGAALYQIDPAPFEANLQLAKANLARAESNQKNAQTSLNRLRPLARTNAVSQQALDDAEAALRQANADVLAQQAALTNAQINLDYTTVHAPISGRIGRSNVTVGALVTTNQALPLAIIQTLDPINVDISYSSLDYLALRDKIAQGKITMSGAGVPVNLVLNNGNKYPHQGNMTFSDLNVDPTTGSILLRAKFSNPDLSLLSGMFVRAIIEHGTQSGVFLVPQGAVARDPLGNFWLWVMDDKNQVHQRTIRTEGVQDNQWIIVEGLKAGEQVVIEGMVRLAPGATVDPSQPKTDAASSTPPAA